MDLSTHSIVALVTDGGGKFILLEDSREPLKGFWAPPHGRCELTDSSEEDGVVREVKEETGLSVVPIRKVWTQRADTKVQTVSFWIVEEHFGELKLNEESSAFGWYDIEEALRLQLYPGTQTFFEMVKAGKLRLK
jgi:8-oxo-dGTP pyrophosphatase MutT (NUDIX family)